MDIEVIHPELQQIARRLPPFPVHHYWFLKFVRFLGRFGVGKTHSLDGVVTRDVQLTHREIRIYQPEGELSGVGVLWMHGGGLIAGSIEIDNLICSRYAKELNAMVVSVEYRLAPEHPYPAASDDCFEAWQWFLSHAQELGVDPGRIAVAGQSGGGARAASLAQRIVDYGGPQPVAQFLFCPMLDDRTALRSELDTISHFLWSNKSNRAAWSWYLGCAAGAEKVPDNAVPARRDDLSGLPATWIGVGDIDLFYQESKSYAERLQAAGVNTEFDVVPQAFHGFEAVAPKTNVTRDYFRRHFDYARKILGLANHS